MSIFIGSIPNTQKDDVLLAKSIFKGKISTEDSIQKLEEEFQSVFNSTPLLFNRGREALYFLLKELQLTKDDEVLVQAFTCIAVVAPILWVKSNPLFVDIDPRTFNMNLDLLKKGISKKTRAIILQHTFGNIADIKKVRDVVDEININRAANRKIYIIEDCAHIFTTNTPSHDIGKYSDFYFFSFAQDKSISCTQGSALFINNQQLQTKLLQEYKKLPTVSNEQGEYIIRYIILWDRIKRNYFKTVIPFTNITVGRIQLILFRLLGLIKKQASLDTFTISNIQKLGNDQAALLLNQLSKAEAFNKHRSNIVANYSINLREELRFNSNNNTLVRYPLLISNRGEIKNRLKSNRIIAGIWYSSPVFPLTSVEELKRCHYEPGSCPLAERLGSLVLNLPTNIEVGKIDMEKIIETVNTFAKATKFN